MGCWLNLKNVQELKTVISDTIIITDVIARYCYDQWEPKRFKKVRQDDFYWASECRFFQPERDNKIGWDYFDPTSLSTELRNWLYKFSMLVNIDHKTTHLNSIFKFNSGSLILLRNKKEKSFGAYIFTGKAPTRNLSCNLFFILRYWKSPEYNILL